MNVVVTIVMYLLWIATIVFVLATTFTNFQHLDLNFIALLLFAFAVINSFFAVTRKK